MFGKRESVIENNSITGSNTNIYYPKVKPLVKKSYNIEKLIEKEKTPKYNLITDSPDKNQAIINSNRIKSH